MFYAMFDDSFFLFFDLEFKTFERVSDPLIRKSTISVQNNLSSVADAHIFCEVCKYDTRGIMPLRIRILKTPT